MRFALEDSSDTNVQLGLLAVQLNLRDFAIRTFNDSCQHDWINKLYQNSSDWEKAIEIAESHDRIHLKNTYYHYARFLEKSGETNNAVEWYEKAGVAHSEIPRLLLPYLSRTFQKAVRVAKESGNRAACYQLAKYYEAKGDYNEAVHFFSLSEAYKSAIRICKECHFDERIVDLALKATNSVMIDAAKYYGKRQGMVDKAVMLYHKAGLHDEAISLASQTEQFTAMNLVASELKLQADPMMLDKCAQFFLHNKQYSKAVELLAEAKRCERAIRISIENNIPLNEKMADLMTPSKEEIEDSKLRNELIEELADSCMKQGLYSCAAKKYIQAGARKKAISFSLVIDVDKSCNYETSLVHLNQSLKCLQEYGSSFGASEFNYRISEIEQKIALMKRFISVKNATTADPNEVIKELLNLLNDERLTETLQVGDIYGAIINQYVLLKDFVELS
ncbi:tetratricopeptide repeat protein [Trichuris suis]|nr:tetratricopeptide repeat protein [Trichuris suis]